MTNHPLLDRDRTSAAGYAAVEDVCRRVLATEKDLFVFQGEAVVALEAVARGLGRPGLRAVNLVSGPYGAVFGQWLAEGGGAVADVPVPFDRAVPTGLVERALDGPEPTALVALVHAEAATGAVNDLAAIARAAKAAGALVAVDAVASVGAEPLLIDEWDLDFVVLSAQKALAGPAGATVVVVSEAGWAALAAAPGAPTPSVLSLLVWRDQWLRGGRRSLPVIPAHLETEALGAAMERVAGEGLGRVIARHRRAATAVRAALPFLSLAPWVADVHEAAAIATLVKAPGPGVPALVAAAAGQVGEAAPLVGAAPGPLAAEAVRVNHTGAAARLASVLVAVTALGRGMSALGHPVDLASALEATAEAWGPDS
jgi:aspartate aminotransferase-like enzyme